MTSHKNLMSKKYSKFNLDTTSEWKMFLYLNFINTKGILVPKYYRKPVCKRKCTGEEKLSLLEERFESDAERFINPSSKKKC